MKYHECFTFSVSKDILKISYDRLATNIPNDGGHNGSKEEKWTMVCNGSFTRFLTVKYST